MANNYETYGEQTTLDELVAHSLTTFEDDRILQIGNNAFYNQSQLTKVVLPNLSSIGSNAFYGCSGLQEIWIDSNSVPSVQSGAIPSQFSSGTGAIYVPSNMVSSYRSNSSWASWKWHVVSKENYPVTDFDSITDSWSTIISKIANGTANYSVGDFKTLDLGAEGKIRMQIAGTEVDELASTAGSYAKYSWVAMDMLNTSHRMNPSLSGTTEGTGAIGGWGKSEMRTYLSTTIWALIPAELQAIIKEVKKYSCIYDTSSTKVTDDVSNDKLWIPSNREVFNTNSYETLGPAYTGIFTSSTDRIRSKSGQSADYWWERSAHSTSRFRYVYNNGSDGTSSADFSSGVVLGFCT